MKKAWLGLSICIILGLAACQQGAEEFSPLPTLAVTEEIPEATSVAVETSVPDITPTPVPTATLKPIETPEPTSTPVPTVTPKPTATPVPTSTARPTSTPAPTSTPKPTATSKPTETPASTSTPKPTVTTAPTETPQELSPEIGRLLEDAQVYKNTVMRGTLCESKEQTTEFVREMAFEYKSFGVLVEDASYLCSADEYMTLFPEIEHMVIEKIDIYRNGVCATIAGVEIPYDVTLSYAIRTGDTSILSETELAIYTYLETVIKETNAKKLSRIEAVKALHDYLVLELKYDVDFQSVSHSPEGVVKNQRAVCDGYARTMRLLLMMTGIESKIVSGTAGGESHAWNLVRMEDGWYHVDVTWDDPLPDVEGKVGYLYFLKNDRDMAKTHAWKSEISCTGNNYQEYVFGEVICDSYDSLKTVYEKQIQTEEYLTFCYPKGGVLNEAMILEFVKEQVWRSITYYPEKELADYMVLEIVNPLWVE